MVTAGTETSPHRSSGAGRFSPINVNSINSWDYNTIIEPL